MANDTLDDRGRLFTWLQRGGTWAYYWTLPDKKTAWHPCSRNGSIPRGTHIYFGVHPTAAKRSDAQRARAQDVCVINCLFAEFDDKAFGGEHRRALGHIHGLPLPPSIIVDSGGGYHCYWLLDRPCMIASKSEWEHADRLQKAWVEFTGGDDGAKDLARILRVPGTLNRKYTPARPVTFHSADFTVLYDLADLEAISFTEKENSASNPPEPVRVGSRKLPDAYAKAALDGELALVRAARELTRNTSLNKAAWSLGQLVGAGALDSILVESELLAAAVASGLPEREAQRTIASGMTAGRLKPRAIPQNGRTDPGAHVDLNQAPDAKTTSADAATKKPPKGPPPTDDELADEWHALHTDTAYGMGEFRRYKAGTWPVVADRHVERELLEVIRPSRFKGARPSARMLASVKKLASVMVGVDDAQWNADPDVVACRNGTLHIPTLTLREHRPQDYQTSGLEFDYDPHVTAPMFDYALHSTIPEAADFLQEFAGYSLTMDTRYELAVWLYGPRGSGRSTILEGLRAMLGERAGILGLADIERSSFALANLPGKTLVISTEQPASYMQSSYVLNAIISGEQVHVDRKFRDPIDIRTHAKIAWAMNDLPRVPDAGDGLFRRVKVIKFPQLPVDPDPTVKETIKSEGAGILNWALAGLARLHARGRFNVPACVKNATDEFQQTNDVPAMFVAERCITGPDLKTGGQVLYDDYKAWCASSGHKPQSSTSLAREWERLGFEGYKAGGRKFYRGIGLLAGVAGVAT